VNEPGPVTTDESRAARPVFVSFSSANVKKALELCESLEARGTDCWISCRDVAPGENYQEAIVRAIQGARAMVLVFSKAANSSDEIKKELSLASRYRIAVMAVRIENIQPTDAFAYELSTRQWIDAFSGWGKAIDGIVRSLEQISQDKSQASAFQASSARAQPFSRRAIAIAASVIIVLAAAISAWLFLRPSGASAHSMQVRLVGFERLSSDLPPTLSDTIRDEIMASFGEQGEVTVSTAAAPPPGSGPAYALGGTMRREGDRLKLLARLTNERDGTMLWSSEFTYPVKAVDKLPRWFALSASDVVRCGLYGASTYPRSLPEATLSEYMKSCAEDFSQAKLADAARRAVKATPDFAAGWVSVGGHAGAQAQHLPSGPEKDALLKEAQSAVERAIKLDPQSSEAYMLKAQLISHGELAAREALYRKALAARPLACGCEHHGYGWFLREVGRTREAKDQFMRALDFVPIDPQVNMDLGETFILVGAEKQAIDQKFSTAADSFADPEFPDDVKITNAPLTGDYRAALEVLRSGREPGLPPAYEKALIAADLAMISGSPAAKANAAAQLAALPRDYRGKLPIMMLGALGANNEALRMIEEMDSSGQTIRARAWLWYPSMAGAIHDPSFPAVAQRLGLMTYWKTSHTKPDVCTAKGPPPFCRMI
jgi:Tfp pilus assembly protein PilF